MANIVPFAEAKLPAFAKAFTETNIEPRNLIPQLSIKGKVWRTVIAGKETKLTKVDGEGDRVPINVIKLVVLQHNKARSRAYYEGEFDDKKPVPPDCWSSDGVTPDDAVKNKQAKSCAKCKQSVKGSKITDAGKESVACAQFKRLAVKPSACFNPDADDETKKMPALLLKLPQTSLWDKDADAQQASGWFAWDQYCDFLRAKGVNHTGMVETKCKFDPDPAYPKVLFSAGRFLAEEEFELAKPLFNDAEVAKLLQAPENEVANNRKPNVEDTEDEEVDPETVATTPAEGTAPKPKKKVVVADDEDEAPAPKKKVVVDDDDEAPPAPKKKAPVAVADDEDEAPAPKKKVAVVDDEDEAPAPKPKKKVVADDEEAPAPEAKAEGKKDSNLKSLLKDWPDDDN